jgi:hypothetical protein
MEVLGMVTAHGTVSLPSPSIDTAEARWAADELAGLIARIGRDSIAGLVLRQAEQELRSLVPEAKPGEVLGPIRIRMAA